MPVLREPKRLSPLRRKLLLRGYCRLLKRAIVLDIVRYGEIEYTPGGKDRVVDICKRIISFPQWPSTRQWRTIPHELFTRKQRNVGCESSLLGAKSTLSVTVLCEGHLAEGMMVVDSDGKEFTLRLGTQRESTAKPNAQHTGTQSTRPDEPTS
jgi:hypothetical protein